MTEKITPALNLIAGLTIDEFKQLIRETVRDTMRDFIAEYTDETSFDNELSLRAEVTHFLRNSLHGVPVDDEAYDWELDD